MLWRPSLPSRLTFPALTGRVVDQANIIPAETRSAIEPKLADLEAKSGIQLVVATVTSLEGQEIEPYANELFRTWKLGEAKKNNGVLLLVAPNERRVRIEVGYGLEGTLTDALSKVIITNAITPRFKAGDFAGGITRGVDDIITVSRPTPRSGRSGRRCGSTAEPTTTGGSTGLHRRCIIADPRLLIVSPRLPAGSFCVRWLFGRAAADSGGGGGWSGGSWRSSAAAASPAAAARRAAAAPRGAGDGACRQQDRERISAAIRAGEARTSGEIVCVLAQTSRPAADGAAGC